jgi:hypothetical protein
VDSQFNLTVVATHSGNIESLGQVYPEGTYLYRYNATGTLTFVKGFGFLGAAAVALTGSSDYVWAISFSSPYDFGSGTYTPDGDDIAVVAWTNAGAPTAAKHLTGDGGALVADIDLDPAGNVVVAGIFSGSLGADGKTAASVSSSTDGFVAKLGKDLSLGWIESLGIMGSNGLPVRDLDVDGKGHAAVVGRFLQSLNVGNVSFTNPNSMDGFLVKFGP